MSRLIPRARLIFATTLIAIAFCSDPAVDSELRAVFANARADCVRRFPNISNQNSELLDYPRTCLYRCLDGQVPVSETLRMPDGWTCATNRTCLEGRCAKNSEIDFCNARIAGVTRVQRVDCQILCTEPGGIAYAYNVANGTSCYWPYSYGECQGGVCVGAPLPEPPFYFYD